MDDKSFHNYRGSEPSEISTKLCVFFIKGYCRRGHRHGGCPDVHDPNARKDFVEAKKARAREAKRARDFETEKNKQKACREKQQRDYGAMVKAAKDEGADKLLAAGTAKSTKPEPVNKSKSADTTANALGSRNSSIRHSKSQCLTPVAEISQPVASETFVAAPKVPKKRYVERHKSAKRTLPILSPHDTAANTVEDLESTALDSSKSAITTTTSPAKVGTLYKPAQVSRYRELAPKQLAEPAKFFSSVTASVPKFNSASKYKQDREAAAKFQRLYHEKQQAGGKPATGAVLLSPPTPPSSDAEITTTNTSGNGLTGRPIFSYPSPPRLGTGAEPSTASMITIDGVVQRPQGKGIRNAHCRYFSAGNCRNHLCPFIHDYKHRHAVMEEQSNAKIARRKAAIALEASKRVIPVPHQVSIETSSAVAPFTACTNAASAGIPSELVAASTTVLEPMPVQKAWDHDEARAWANTNLRIKGSQIAYARLLAPYVIENRMSEIPYELLVGQPIPREEGESFRAFGGLAPELRNAIWDFAIVNAISETRKVRVEFMAIENRPYVISRSCAPALLHTCRDSRSRAMKHYNYAFRTPVPKPLGVYFNLSTDQLFINSRGPEDFKWVCLCIAPEDRHQIKHLELPAKDYIRNAEKFLRRLCTYFPFIETLTITAGDSTLDQMCVRRDLARKLTGCISLCKERWMRRSGLGAKCIPKVRVATVSALLANRWGIDDLQYCG
ncbi:hypothetical protein QTJ16_003121 [Diplocarpon rosae]|uniref:C3H1-type domain-containing protein n=1 Tax=Diplocarpon rosae TaxID=946125 RepID=A0AAD9T2K0_9HELO|nr:hypothetical protein QTJ16_003121 [Diplocarpon rosae]